MLGNNGVSAAFWLEHFDREKEKTDSEKMVKNDRRNLPHEEKLLRRRQQRQQQ